MSYTIVILYKDEVHKGLELKYALRSIEKYLSGWSNIILVGEKSPSWYKGAIIYCADQPGMKNFNIYNKVLASLLHVTDDFIMWHDDHYLLHPLHVSEIKYWHNGLLSDELKRNLGGWYRKAVENTLALMEEIKPNRQPASNFDIHVPIIFNKKKFKETFENRQQELCVKSFYFWNSADGETDFPEAIDDCKIPFQMPYERLKEKIAGRTFFSIHSAAIGPELIRLWEELYPEKSKFEL